MDVITNSGVSADFHFFLSKFDEIITTLYFGCLCIRPLDHFILVLRGDHIYFNVSSLYYATFYLLMYYGHVGVPSKANLFS